MSNRLQQLKDEYDVVVVGGGIYGAALFWEATSRGLKVLMVEQHDFGSATSQNSLKIIHGGIRYLQTLNFSRIKESINENKYLVCIAPHLVKPLECLAILGDIGIIEKLKISLGAFFYNILASSRNKYVLGQQRYRNASLLHGQKLVQKFMTLDVGHSHSGLHWHDAQVTNTERLLMAFIMSAVGAGSKAINYVQCLSHKEDNGKIKSVIVRDSLSGQEKEIAAKAIYYCVGPWLDANESKINHLSQQTSTKVVRAANIIVNRKPEKFALGLQAKKDTPGKQRYLFITPWCSKMMIGTWYFATTGSEHGRLKLSKTELQMVLDDINNLMPSLAMDLGYISLVHIGELPVSEVNTQDPESELLEENSIISAKTVGGPDNLYCVQGVKYTTARSAAVKAIDRLAVDMSDTRILPSATHSTPLYGGAWASHKTCLDDLRCELKHHISDAVLDRLVSHYGAISKDIIRFAEDNKEWYLVVPGQNDILKAEVHYLIAVEMSVTVQDLLRRRLGIGSLEKTDSATIEFCAATLQLYYNYEQSELDQQIKEYLTEYSW